MGVLDLPAFTDGGEELLDMVLGAEEVHVDGRQGQMQRLGDFCAGLAGQAQADDGLLARREGGEGRAEARGGFGQSWKARFLREVY